MRPPHIALALLLAGCSASPDGSPEPSKPGSARSDASSASTPASSSTTDPPRPSDGGPPSSAIDGGDAGDQSNCVPKGYPGNDKKIGAYCDDQVACPFQLDPFLVCTAGHASKTHLFCTSPCSTDSQCGSGAYCMHDTGGSGCVPTQCGGKPGS